MSQPMIDTIRRFLRTALRDDFTVTKALLGWAMITGGAALAIIMIAAEVLDTDSGGFGTVQQLGTALGIGALIIGFTLLPLGTRGA